MCILYQYHFLNNYQSIAEIVSVNNHNQSSIKKMNSLIKKSKSNYEH